MQRFRCQPHSYLLSAVWKGQGKRKRWRKRKEVLLLWLHSYLIRAAVHMNERAMVGTINAYVGLQICTFIGISTSTLSLSNCCASDVPDPKHTTAPFSECSSADRGGSALTCRVWSAGDVCVCVCVRV